ncbi:hypothetical protein [Rhodoblastus sp.]|uniref:hypothetical protein n=1 Tax=Rhodoblastus sp. TaxID=1962975 RepID=UPI003F959D54
MARAPAIDNCEVFHEKSSRPRRAALDSAVATRRRKRAALVRRIYNNILFYNNNDQQLRTALGRNFSTIPARDEVKARPCDTKNQFDPGGATPCRADEIAFATRLFSFSRGLCAAKNSLCVVAMTIALSCKSFEQVYADRARSGRPCAGGAKGGYDGAITKEKFICEKIRGARRRRREGGEKTECGQDESGWQSGREI